MPEPKELTLLEAAKKVALHWDQKNLHPVDIQRLRIAIATQKSVYQEGYRKGYEDGAESGNKF